MRQVEASRVFYPGQRMVNGAALDADGRERTDDDITGH
jgi:hypothetical protein